MNIFDIIPTGYSTQCPRQRGSRHPYRNSMQFACNSRFVPGTPYSPAQKGSTSTREISTRGHNVPSPIFEHDEKHIQRVAIMQFRALLFVRS